jgi:hypothetical protein
MDSIKYDDFSHAVGKNTQPERSIFYIRLTHFRLVFTRQKMITLFAVSSLIIGHYWVATGYFTFIMELDIVSLPLLSFLASLHFSCVCLKDFYLAI